VLLYIGEESEVRIPHLPEDLEVEGMWSETQIAEAFGDLAPVLEHYQDLWEPGLGSEIEVTNALVDRLHTLTDYGYAQPEGARASVGTRVYFAEDVAAAGTELEALLVCLRKGFERLAEMAPGG
jgi:hypothetical protein